MSSPAPSKGWMLTSACTCASATTGPGPSGTGRIGRSSRTSAGRRSTSSRSSSPAGRWPRSSCSPNCPRRWTSPSGWSTSRTPGSSRAELVAERLRMVLKYVAPERVSVTPDCGFSQTARHIAVAKARAMVEGVKRVREELKPMIEPVRQGAELVEEIEGTIPAPGIAERLVAGPERLPDQVAHGLARHRPLSVGAPDEEIRGDEPAARPDDPGAAPRRRLARLSTWCWRATSIPTTSIRGPCPTS